MGLLSKVGRFAKSTTKKIPVLPLVVAVPRAVRTNNKLLTQYFKSIPMPFCPNCGEGKLTPIEWHELPFDPASDNPDKMPDLPTDSSESGTWRCTHCGYTLRINHTSIAALEKALREHGREIYEQTQTYQRDSEEVVAAINQTIRNRVISARIFATMFGLCILIVLYAAFTVNLRLILSMLCFSMVMLTMSWKFGYRAWQLYTDNIFVPDAKAQFKYWLVNHKWYAYPTDDGYNPFVNQQQLDEPIEVMDDYSDFDEEADMEDDISYSRPNYQRAIDNRMSEMQTKQPVAHGNVSRYPNFSNYIFTPVSTDIPEGK